jgi:hypothetical protein
MPAATSKIPGSVASNGQECAIHQQEGVDSFYHQAFGACTAKVEKFFLKRGA